MNAFGVGSADDVKTAAIDGLGRLSTYTAKSDMNIIVENHGVIPPMVHGSQM